MPRSGNGIGTVYFGRSLDAEDGSYVTTVWFVLFFLPILPLRSERVLPLSQFTNGAGHTRTRYSVISRVPLVWSEVLKSYLVGWGILAWYVSLIYTFEPLDHYIGGGAWIVLCWFVFPFLPLVIWQKWLRPRPKLRPVEVMPGSEFTVFRKTETDDEQPR
jgi:hypothetical protein